MKRELLDQFGRSVTRTVTHNPNDWFGDFAIETVQDVEPIIDFAKDKREAMDGIGLHNIEMRHAAEIPLTVFEQALREGWADDPKAWKRWANDPANKAFRVWEGQL